MPTHHTYICTQKCHGGNSKTRYTMKTHGMFFALLVDYVRWHYGEALVHYLRLLKTLWWFVTAYFSVPLLLVTLFSPYKRLYEPHRRGESIGTHLEHLVINTLSRCIGFVVRLCLIVAAGILLVTITIGGICGYGLWLIAPAIPALATGAGIFLLMSSFFGL
jgi:hypothetical protein